jgi:small-conductance mechanosensitive channel
MANWYFLATGVLFLSNAVAETIVASPKIDPEGIQASYIRAVFGLFGLISMALLMLTGLFKVGVSLGPLLAGAGIGGLAVALAARPTFENVISSFMIFLDKPYRVGQRDPNEAINQPDFPPRVYFNDLNADSLSILVIYWYHPPEHWDYLEHAHWVNVQIMERFNAEGIDFAFPTQTLHLAGDEKRPLEVEQQKLFADDTISERT